MTEPRWPAGAGPRVLVADGWWANAGDAAIGLAMDASLRRLLGEVRLVFCVHHRALVEPHYPEFDEDHPAFHSALAQEDAWLVAVAEALMRKSQTSGL